MILAIFAQSAGIFYLYTNNIEINKTKNQLSQRVNEFENSKFQKLNFIDSPERLPDMSEYQNIQAVPQQQKEISDLEVTGWIPDWGFQAGFQTLQTQSKTFSSISPFWYELQSDGSLKTLPVANNQSFISYVRQNNITLIPTITNFDAELFSSSVSAQENIDRQVNSIIQVVKDNNYDGIDLDYEMIYLKDKENFFIFLQKLSSELNKIEKQLVVTVLPRWGNEVVHLGTPETRMVQDYKKIADLADELRIMTYEYAGRDNKYYAPIAPISWLEDVVRYAILSGVPREKIMLGIHTYGYDYPDRQKMPEIEYYPVLKNIQDGKKAPAAAYYTTQVEQIKSRYSVTEEYEQSWGESLVRYNRDGVDRVIVYPNQRSINDRKELAAKYGIKGVAIWKLGDDGSLIY